MASSKQIKSWTSWITMRFKSKPFSVCLMLFTACLRAHIEQMDLLLDLLLFIVHILDVVYCGMAVANTLRPLRRHLCLSLSSNTQSAQRKHFMHSASSQWDLPLLL